MKHTPGPWHTEFEDEVYSADNRMVADIYGYGEGNAAANARLIAAAPEMLEIVQKFVAALNTNYSASTMNYEFGADARRLLARIEGD